MSQKTNTTNPATRLVSALMRLESEDRGSDRATMANLRAGLRAPNGVAVEMMALIAPFLPAYESERDERFFQIAALFALHPENSYSQSFAGAFRQLADKGSDSIEKRFQMLLACGADRLFHHLQQCVSLLKSESIPLNWRQLLGDLTFHSWDDPNRPLQLKWAREFYRKPSISASLLAGDPTPLSASTES